MSTRASPGRPPIELDRILTVALRIVDEQGPEALTMRRLAQDLGSGTATLYRHFESREQLIAQVVDQLFGKMQGKPPGMGDNWLEACRELARHKFAVLSRHRGAARLLLNSPPTGPNAMRQRERSLTMLLAAGFTPALAARAYATLARFVLGFAIQLGEEQDDSDQAAFFQGLDEKAFPGTSTVAAQLPVPLEDEFAFGLDLMLEGLKALHARALSA